MTIAIYWIQSSASELFPSMHEPKCKIFPETQLNEAMTFMREKRVQPGVSHVGMVSEPEGMVGTKDAGGAVKDGKLPDGTAYGWKMRRV